MPDMTQQITAGDDTDESRQLGQFRQLGAPLVRVGQVDVGAKFYLLGPLSATDAWKQAQVRRAEHQNGCLHHGIFLGNDLETSRTVC